MGDFAANNMLCSPLVALLTSNGADASAEKNGLNFSDMLGPFCTAQVTVKDPMGQQVNTRLKIDVRDIRRSGFLLSHTVLPHVLYEAILSLANGSFTDSDEDAFTLVFANSFLYWFEPADHDFLRTYLCCIFVVSTADEDPLEELNRLQYQQHLQQHGSAESSTSFSLPHCAKPKWMLPNILKYYVLIEDVLKENSERTKQIFTSMVSKYGLNLCHLLRINSAEFSEMPDPWTRLIEQRYRGLQSGLESARRNLLAKSQALSEASQENNYSSLSNQFVPARSSTDSSSLAFVSNSMQSPSSSLFTTTSAATALHNSSGISSTKTSNGFVPPNFMRPPVKQTINYPLGTLLPQDFLIEPSNGNTDAIVPPAANLVRGQCLDAEDRERIRSFVEEFMRNALVPFVERQLAAQNEILANRRTIGKSFTNVRKWLSAASSNTAPTSNSSIVYGAESSESQTRCLADMAFQFGLYNFALQLYQSLKKDFANDQTWLHHAGALEMAAFASFLSVFPFSLQLNNGKLAPGMIANLQRNYPQRYMENAINYYLNVCLQPMIALRCLIMSTEILSRLQLYPEAASQIVRLHSANPNLPELFYAILLEHAAFLYLQAKQPKRMAFYSVLAGHRYSKVGLKKLSLSCYKKALPLFAQKGWDFAEDHIVYTLSSQNEFNNDPEFAIECASRLLRRMGKQTAAQQAIFLAHYVKILRKYRGLQTTGSVCLPLVNHQLIMVFYGDCAKLSSKSFSVPVKPIRQEPEIGGQDALEMWEVLEKALCYHHSSFCGEELKEVPTLFADERTDNSREAGYWTPAFEPITVQIQLTNPLAVPLVLRRLRLGIGEIETVTKYTPEDSLIQDLSQIDELILPPYNHNPLPVHTLDSSQVENSPDSSHSITINLSIIPTDYISSFSIQKIEFDLCAPTASGEDTWLSVPGFISLQVRGKRLWATTEQRMNKAYAIDNRLKVRVCQPQKAWPLLDFRLASNAGKNPQQQQHVNAYCSQIYQIIAQVENVGKFAVKDLYMACNQPELVSLSELEKEEGADGNEKWRLCPTHWVSTEQLGACNEGVEEAVTGVLIHKLVNVSRETPCVVGQSLRLKLAFRAPSQPSASPCQLYFLFFYIGENGASRQFRYRLCLSTQSLLATSIRAITPSNLQSNGLCILHLRNLNTTRDTVLAKIELQRLALVVLEAEPIQQKKGGKELFRVVNLSNQQTNPLDICIRPVSERPVVLDSDQSLNYCLYIHQQQPSSSSSQLWLTNSPPDIPQWSHLIPPKDFSLPELTSKGTHQSLAQAELNPGSKLAHLRLAVLWKANIAKSNGTVATVFGENLLANPFGEFNEEKGIFQVPGQLQRWFLLSASEIRQLQAYNLPAGADKQQRSTSAMSSVSGQQKTLF